MNVAMLKFNFLNLVLEIEFMISDSKADVAVAKQRLLDHAKVLVCIIQYVY
jgi:hypothetical protein